MPAMTRRSRHGAKCPTMRDGCGLISIRSWSGRAGGKGRDSQEAKAPATSRRFAGPWSELDYLCKKISYWLYAEPNRDRARRYASRLNRVLRQVPDDDLAILRQEGLALASELRGELADAIAHRRREIRLIERLQSEAQSPRYSDKTKTYMLRDRSGVALAERRDILDALETLHARRGAVGRFSN